MKSQIIFGVMLAFLMWSSLIENHVMAQQIEIARINTMPNFPQPYHMRDWKNVARGYDSLVFDISLSGQYLPLVFFRQQSVNYPQFSSFGLHTAVGTNAPTSGEAINAIPAVVGATLVGVDKSDQFDENWALMVQEFFNNRPEENIYLNHPSANSGFDWWYETMPNVFFMQLKDLYPELSVFDEQLPVMAGQWLKAVKAMGASDTPWNVPYMNYRAWNMASQQPLDHGVRQPEAAGAIAWLLYNSWLVTGEQKYRKGAEWAMEFLDQWSQNPSYELQLPYGIYTAARMNAELGTQYNIEKMVNWAFDRGALRGWGAISGTWGGLDCHGLIGEANDNGNDYAFMMNGFQQAAALVPMVRYDSRFAAAIAKWVLNMANASRLFYPLFLPADMQDNAGWAQTYDPNSYIAYEALREVKHGKRPYATGDAIEGGWAQTNLMLYGSSHVGYLAAIVDTTQVEGILQLDLLKTDFFKNTALPTFLYYNPHTTNHNVNLYLPQGVWKIYDVISKTFLHENLSDVAVLSIGAAGLIMPVLVPQEALISFQGHRTLANDIIIDYHNGQDSGFLPPRIKSLAAVDTMVVAGNSTTIFCTAVDPQQLNLTYQWLIDGQEFAGSEQFVFQAPAQIGWAQVAVVVTNEEGLKDSVSITIQVVEKIPYVPQIISIEANPRKIRPGETLQVQCVAEDFYNDPLFFHWTATAGTITGNTAQVNFTAPANPGDYTIGVEVSNEDGLSTTGSIKVMVRHFEDEPAGNLIAHYPLRGNAQDVGGNNLHGTPGGGLTWGQDMNGHTGAAAFFNGSSANILMPPSPLLNFSDAMGITTFLRISEFTTWEQHPLSHGSWEHRYKISVGGQKLRFTLNTHQGIKDLDTETSLEAGKWYHVAVMYDGNDMEIWLDGKLDAFTSHAGQISTSPHNLVLGQNIPGNNNYNFFGSMALLSLYDHALSPMQIAQDVSLSANPIRAGERGTSFHFFPNPVSGGRFTLLLGQETDAGIVEIRDIYGRVVHAEAFDAGGARQLQMDVGEDMPGGLYIISVSTRHLTLSHKILFVRTR